MSGDMLHHANCLPVVNGYDLAVAALVALKGQNVVDVARDDRTISYLSKLTPAVTRKLIKCHRQLALGYPSEATIDIALIHLENGNELGPSTDTL